MDKHIISKNKENKTLFTAKGYFITKHSNIKMKGNGIPHVYNTEEIKLIDDTVLSLKMMRHENGGRLPWGTMTKTVKKLRKTIPTVTRDVLNGRLTRLDEKVKISFIESDSEEDAVEAIEVIDETTLSNPKKRGRIVGSTNKNIKEYNQTIIDCRNAIAREVFEYQKNLEGRLPVGYIDSIIEKKKEEFKLPDTVIISKRTIQNRLRNGRKLECQHRGPESPLKDVENVVVELCIALNKIGQPLSARQGLELTNSIIDGTDIQDFLINWKDTNGLTYENLQKKKRVGKGYWRKVRKRNKHKLDCKKGKRWHTEKARWSKRKYVEDMFRDAYDTCILAKLARRLEKPVMRDAEGNIVTSEKDSYGEPCDIEIMHPDHLLFADETGCNTNQRDDKNISGTQYLCGKDEDPKLLSVGSNHRFTLFPIIAATGEPVVYVIIFQRNKDGVPPLWHSGVDIRQEPITDENGDPKLCEENCGPGRYFPGAPVCHFRGIDIQAISYTSASGSMTPQILVNVLKYLDQLKVFPRKEGGPKPVIILDGHATRLSYDFLKYINDKNHYWFANLGTPYLTHLWQVADSAELNGKFKTEWYRSKDHLLRLKIRQLMPEKLDATDVMPLLNEALSKSFQCVELSKKVISERGWYPPNRKLLSSKEVMGWIDFGKANNDTSSEKSNVEHSELDSIIGSLNISDGFANEVMRRFVRRILAEQHAREQFEADRKKGKTALALLEAAKRLTAGVLVGNEIYSLNHPALLQYHENKKEKEKQEHEKSAKTKKNSMKKRRETVKQARAKSNDLSKWTVPELKALFQYKKQPGDGGAPKGKAELLKTCIRMDINRPSPPCSDAESDDETDLEDLEEVGGRMVIARKKMKMS